MAVSYVLVAIHRRLEARECAVFGPFPEPGMAEAVLTTLPAEFQERWNFSFATLELTSPGGLLDWAQSLEEQVKLARQTLEELDREEGGEDEPDPDDETCECGEPLPEKAKVCALCGEKFCSDCLRKCKKCKKLVCPNCSDEDENEKVICNDCEV